MRTIFTKRKNEWQKVSVDISTPVPTIKHLTTTLFEKKFGYSEKMYQNKVEGFNSKKLSTVKALLTEYK